MGERSENLLQDTSESKTEHEQRIAATLAAGVLASLSPIGTDAELTARAVRVYREILGKLDSEYI